MNPEPVTPESEDLGRRAQSVYDLEVTLVKFLERMFSVYRFDNPTLNLAQATAPTHPIVVPPDNVVSYDPVERAETLYLKVPPRIERGRVPRTVTGEIAVDKLPDCPSIIVQVINARVEMDNSNTTKVVTVRILVSAYDENPNSQGYQDCLNMMEAIEIAFTSFGQQGIDQAYPIQLPIDWKLVEADCFPHYIGEMTTSWVLPAGRPMPEEYGFIPAEHLDFRIEHIGGRVAEFRPVVTPPVDPPPVEPLSIQDNFDRADGQLGANWAKPPASEHTLVIVNNQVTPNIDGGHSFAFWIGNVFNQDQYAQAKLVDIGIWSGVIVRATVDVDAFYLAFVFSANDYRIFLRKDGNYSQLISASAATWSDGDVMRLEARGLNPVELTLLQNGVPVLSYTDTTENIVGGAAGLGVYNLQHLDDFEGGDLT